MMRPDIHPDRLKQAQEWLEQLTLADDRFNLLLVRHQLNPEFSLLVTFTAYLADRNLLTTYPGSH